LILLRAIPGLKVLAGRRGAGAVGGFKFYKESEASGDPTSGVMLCLFRVEGYKSNWFLRTLRDWLVLAIGGES